MNRLLACVLIALFPGVALPCWNWCRRPAPVVVSPPVVHKDPEAEKWVTIRGRIVWDANKGAPPKRAEIKATRDAQVAKMDGDFYTEEWVINEANYGIKNVVVWLAPEPTPEQLADLKNRKLRTFPSFAPLDIHPSQSKGNVPAVTMDIPYLRFSPHILAAQTGQNVIFKNSTTVPHNVKWTSRENEELNLLLPPRSHRAVPDLKAEKFPIELTSSIHPWMKAYVRIFDHPYFALTDYEGKFEIKNAPVLKGKLRIFIWQETAGILGGVEGRFGQTIEVTGGVKDLNEIKFTTDLPK